MLSFDPDRHRYFWDGVPVPSVTRVLQSTRLVDFSGINAEVLAYARSLGTSVHIATALDDTGDLVPESVPDVVAPYLAAWRRFRAECEFVPDRVEHRIFNHAYRYAGTLDRTGRMRKTPVLVDVKTGQPTRAAGYQTAAYLAALPRQEWRRKRFAVHLNPDGTYRLVPYLDRGDLAVFLAALTIHNTIGANQ